MNVITCLQPVNRHFTQSPKKTQNKKLKLDFYNTSLALFPVFFAILILFYLPIFKLEIAISKIEPISFWEEPSVQKALRTYSLPLSTNQKGDTNIAAENLDLISTVEFSNYTVKSGDTISGIVQKFNLKNMGTLLSINKITNVRKIQVGQMLKIPSTDGIFYEVAKGDSLNLIATKFKLPITSILDANDLDTQTINIGQKLFIPGAVINNFDLKKALGELFIYPIIGRLTSGFGYRIDPFTGRKSFHNGIDLATAIGTPVKSTMAGRIAFVGTSPIYGNYIIVSHERGYQSMYGHLHSVKVRRGQVIAQGKIIGTVGSTGRSTGPHVHFSIYKNGKLLNPLKVLK